jgi:hypothetical protein
MHPSNSATNILLPVELDVEALSRPIEPEVAEIEPEVVEPAPFYR